MDCVDAHLQGPAGTLASVVASVPAPVVVLVAAEDRGAARREVPGATLVTRTASEATLEEAAGAVFPVPGRCVVLADALDGDRWDLVVTPGSSAPLRSLPLPSLPASPAWKPGPADPRRLDTVWAGAGVSAGFPNIVGGLATLKIGPVVGEVDALPLLLAYTAYARAGVLVPIPALLGPDAIAVGGLGGAQTWWFFEGDRASSNTGLDLVGAVEWLHPVEPRVCLFVRGTAGAVWWRRAPSPSAQLAFGAMFGAGP